MSGSREPGPRLDRALAALLLATALLYALGLRWGLDRGGGFDYDELHASQVLASLHGESKFGWPIRYPPLQLYLLAVPALTLDALQRLASPPAAQWFHAALVYLPRVASLLFGVGTVWLTVLAARELFDRRAAWLAGFAQAVTLPAVYYSKLGNLDAPSLFWVALSLLFYLRLLARQRLRDHVGFALAAAAAVATKDQAVGFYTLAPLAILAARLRQRRAAGERGGALALLADRRLLALLGALVLGFALAHNLPLAAGRFTAHVRALVAPGSAYLSFFPPTLAGHLQMAAQTLRQLDFCFGWPLLAASLLGIALALGRAPVRQRWLALAALLLAASYYFTLLSVIRAVLDRYLMPVVLVLALFAGRGLAELLGPGGGARWPRRLALGAVLAFSALRALSLDLLLLADSRYAALEWVERHAAPDRIAVALGRPRLLPRLPVVTWSAVSRTHGRVLLAPAIQHVVVNVTDLRKDSEKAFYRRMREGALPYRLAATPRGRPWLDWIDTRGIHTNLEFVNPEMAVFERQPALQ